MGKYTIDLIQRFGVAFGQLQQRLIKNALGQTYETPTPYEEDQPIDGSPFFDEVEFDYKNEKGEAKSYKFELPPMIDLRMSKKLNITTLNEAIVNGKSVGGGEVIESMGNQNWDITFRGLLVDMKNHKRPLDQIKALTDFVKLNGTFEVKTCKYFIKVGIDQVFIKDISLPPLEGYQDTQPFIIEARSYAPATLYLNN